MPSSFSRRCALFSVAVLVGLLPLSAQGAAKKETPPEPKVVRFTINVDKPASHYVLPLTPEVYAAVNTANLGDLCVRNAAGEDLPFGFSRPAAPDRRKERALPAAEVQWFPMPVHAADAGDPAAPLGVTIAPDGSLRAAPGSRPVSEKRPGEVISLVPLWSGVDPREASNTRLTLTIDIAEPEYRGGLRLSESDDLNHVRSVGSGQLLFLRNDKETLVANRVELSGVRGKYLLLYWDQTPPTVTGIRAEMVLEEEEIAPPPTFPVSAEDFRAANADPAGRQFLQVPGEKDADGNIVFHLNAHPPVDYVQLDLPRQNTLAPGVFFSGFRAGAFQGRVSDSTQFFRLTSRNGTETRNRPLRVDVNRDAEWQFRPESKSFASGEPPRLAVSWQPDMLTFVAGGEGPYTLMTGCSGSNPPQSVKALYPEGLERDAAPAFLSAGEKADGDTPAAPTDTRKMILWGVLGLGLAFLGFMAYRLARGAR